MCSSVSFFVGLQNVVIVTKRRVAQVKAQVSSLLIWILKLCLFVNLIEHKVCTF